MFDRTHKKTPDELRSARWFAPDDLRSFGHRSRIMQMGYGPADYVGKPIIGILNTWSDLNPCHVHFKHRVEDVKRGVLEAGGFPVEMPALTLSESFMKPTTMLYRNLLAMETEEQIRAHPVDGVVLMGGCDKTTPGLIMGALSAGLPMIYFPAGPMLRGNYAGQQLGSGSDAWKFWDERRAGNISDKQWLGVEGGIARSYGHCMTMGTASTMTAIADAMGLTLPGASSIPAPDANHIRMAAECGRRIVGMVWEDLTPDQIVTPASVRNAATVAMATGCSTNAVVHLLAMARRGRVPLTLDDLDALGRTTPLVANVRPSGQGYLMEDFFYAGGLLALMNNIREKLDLSCLTVTGRTLGEALEGAEVYNDDVIRPLSNPVYHEGSLAVLKGNLAPDGAVIKPAACDPRFHVHEGPAIVFDSYPEMKKFVDDEASEVTADHVMVLQERRPARRPGDAGVGDAAAAEEAGEGGPPRHAAALRRAHVGHELRRLRAARRAGELRRRAAGAAQDRRHRALRRAGPAHRHGCVRERAGRSPRQLEEARAALRARLRLGLLAACGPGRPGVRLRLPRAGVRPRRRRAGHLLMRRSGLPGGQLARHAHVPAARRSAAARS